MTVHQNNPGETYALRDIFVMQYVPKNRSLVIRKRNISSFLYILRGQYHYHSDDFDFIADTGDTVYLPKNSRYVYTVLSEQTECIQLHFDLIKCCGEKISYPVFSARPAVIKDRDGEFKFFFFDLLKSFGSDTYATVSLVFRIIARFVNAYGDSESADMRKIAPAVNYIQQHYCEKLYVAALAEICHVSESHFRRLFHQCMGMSPIQYKNDLVIRTACHMLGNEQMNVSEAAQALQFQDIYTFSQLFKKCMGISPKKYSNISKMP